MSWTAKSLGNYVSGFDVDPLKGDVWLQIDKKTTTSGDVASRLMYAVDIDDAEHYSICMRFHTLPPIGMLIFPRDNPDAIIVHGYYYFDNPGMYIVRCARDSPIAQPNQFWLKGLATHNFDKLPWFKDDHKQPDVTSDVLISETRTRYLGVRSRKALALLQIHHNIRYVSQITYDAVLGIKNCGVTTACELTKWKKEVLAGEHRES